MVRPDGATVWAELLGRKVGETGQRTIGVLRDASDRKAAEEALRESEALEARP